jgi:hypothetical protein
MGSRESMSKFELFDALDERLWELRQGVDDPRHKAPLRADGRVVTENQRRVRTLGLGHVGEQLIVLFARRASERIRRKTSAGWLARLRQRCGCATRHARQVARGRLDLNSHPYDLGRSPLAPINGPAVASRLARSMA